MTVQDGFGRGSGVFRRKPIEQISDEKTTLTRTLGLWQLTAIGIGGIIGAGIFSLAGGEGTLRQHTCCSRRDASPGNVNLSA